MDSLPLVNQQESYCWKYQESENHRPRKVLSSSPPLLRRQRCRRQHEGIQTVTRVSWNMSFILLFLLIALLLLGPTTTTTGRHVQGFQSLPPPQPFPKRAFVLSTKMSLQKHQYQKQKRRSVSPCWFISNNSNNNNLQQQQQQHRLPRVILYDSEVNQETRDIVDMSSLTHNIINNHTTHLANIHHNDDALPQQQQQQQQHLLTDNVVMLENNETDKNAIEIDDVPMRTENGGFTHTRASRAKISAANKGNTPWNKGQQRSEDVKARIAAGVRARNRIRFLQKLEQLNLTEAEYYAEQEAIQAQNRADREARRTARGGFRPTEETKRKISHVLKAKYANTTFRHEQQQKRRQQQMSSGGSNKVVANVRRGFTHSDETKRKISLALRERWANDEVYRQNMKLKCITANNRPETKMRISQALRQKWQNPEFRQDMITKFQNRSNNSNSTTLSSSSSPRSSSTTWRQTLTHREKISAAMKAKWQDEAYRQKALAAIQAKKQRRQEGSSAMSIVSSSTTMGSSSSPTMTLVQPKVQLLAKRKEVEAKKMSQQMVRLVEPRMTTTTTETPPPNNSKQIMTVSERKQTTARVVVKKKKASTSSSKKDVASVAKMTTKASTARAIISENSSPLTMLATKKGGAVLNGGAVTADTGKRVKGEDDAHDSYDDADDVVDSASARSRGRKKTTGSVSQLRKERRDLYDLLYGDDDDDEYNQHDDDDDGLTMDSANRSEGDNDDSRMHQLQQQAQSQGGRKQQQQHKFDAQEIQRHRNGYSNDDNNSNKRKFTSMDFGLGDENLDDYDPYGLEDF